MFKSILCLNGNLPDRDTIIKFIKGHKHIIAADGAANTLKNLDIIPSTIIGDLDSLNRNLDFENAEIIKIENQNYTDFEKCISYIIEHRLFPTLVLGMSGGEIDHVIDNINKFIKYSSKIPMVFFDAPNKWGIVIDKSLLINSKESSTVSIFPFIENTHIKSEGLHWELNSNEHGMFKNTSTRNKMTDKTATISSSKELVLVITESDSLPFNT